MLKKILLLVVVSLVALTGCIGYNTKWEPSWTNGFEHEKTHFRVLWQDMADVHRFIDRHLFNLDEDDPSRY
ncbi:MAG: hypothetical protein V1709_10160 [Planctomycetota bacterium]